MEKETYKVARELLEKYDPSNPSLQVTPSRGAPRRSSNQNTEGEVRHRRPPPTPHPSLMPQNIAMATPSVVRPPVVPMATPVVSNQQQPPSAAPTLRPPAPSVPATPQPSLQHIPPGTVCTGGLLTHAMEAHCCDCIIEGDLLTYTPEGHYCDCGLLTRVNTTNTLELLHMYCILNFG